MNEHSTLITYNDFNTIFYCLCEHFTIFIPFPICRISNVWFPLFKKAKVKDKNRSSVKLTCIVQSKEHPSLRLRSDFQSQKCDNGSYKSALGIHLPLVKYGLY